MRRVIYFIFVLFGLISLTGCQLTAEQQAQFDPEKAALARLKLGLAYLAQADESPDNIKLAHYNLSQANKYSPNNPHIMLGMAMFDQHVGEDQEAESIYKVLTKRYPENGLYYIHYASFLCAKDNYAEAKPLFEYATNLNRPQWKMDGLEQLGYCAIQNHDQKTANQAFETLFKYDATKRDHVKHVAEIYREKGDNNVADYLLKITTTNKL
ncbi:hypothetical protein RCS94_11210 [Orbaceae bacterium ac157xtp]